VSQENVELVLRAYPSSAVNVVTLVRDEQAWAIWRGSIAPLFAPDAETVWPGLPGGATRFTGLDGLRAALLDWTAPWTAFRTQVDRSVDCDRHVVLLAPSFGRLAAGGGEVSLDGASAWTVDDGKISWSYHSSKSDVLKRFGGP
jgi:hypothetical protein